MYRFEYEITEHDYMQFNEYHLLNSPSGKRTLLLTKCMGFIVSIAIIIAAGIIGNNKGQLIVNIIFLAVFSIIWFARGKRIALKSMCKQMNKLKKEKGKLYSDKGTLTFDENGITDISEDKELKTPYSTVTQLCTGNNALYIYFSPIIAYIVPVRLLDDNSDEFKTFLERKTGLTFK